MTQNKLREVVLFDFTFTVSDSIEEVTDGIAAFDSTQLTANKKPFLITPNVDDIVNWNKEKYQQLKNEYRNSVYIIPDGQPLVLFSKVIRKSLIKVTPGSTMFPLIWKKIKSKNRKAFLILANKELCSFYENEYPLARAYAPPFFQADDAQEIAKIVKKCVCMIEEHKPEFVFVGIQFPKQNIIALELYKTVKVSVMPLFLMLGASMEFYSGRLKRSPRFFQRIGMEWFYRFCQQPKKLFKRYFINDLSIFLIFFREILKTKK
jgi:N-acetylglucosaminyldiphosphoundecaprenol N-acetyl-beta-D-mannosaminyltransferase